MGEFWQTTAQMYGSLFEKPKMLEKLLVKPPFKYIFDIITETTKATGFAEGLYSSEEQNPEIYSQKESKILYLKKMIELVQLITKKELAVKPNKVVSGLEPENTNAFLQELYKAAVSGNDSKPFVKKILAKYAKMGEDDPEETKDDKKPAQKEEPVAKKEEIPVKKPAKPEENKPKEPVKKKDSVENVEKPKPKEPVKKEENLPKKEEPKKDEKKPAAKPVAKETREENGGNPSNIAMNRPGSASKKAAKIKTNVITDQKVSAKGEGTANVIIDKKNPNEDDEDMTIREENAGFKGNAINQEGKGKFTKETLKEESENLNDATNTEKKPEEKTKSTVKMGKIGLNKKKDELSKNYYEAAGSSSTSAKFDVEAIKKLIQSLCQNTNPLGKSLEFLNDDIESMNKESEYWKKQYLGSKQKFQSELKRTDEELQPLNDKMTELDEQIRDQKSRIQSLRAQIIKNTGTIQNLLYSVVTNK